MNTQAKLVLVGAVAAGGAWLLYWRRRARYWSLGFVSAEWLEDFKLREQEG